MVNVLWLLIGLLIGVAGMALLIRRLLRRAEHRARTAERRARTAERLAELGSITGGLAHEIKNPLSTIGLNAQLLLEGLAESDLPEEQRSRLTRRLTALAREVERLRAILADFLQFAGRVRLDPQPRDFIRLVEEVSDFFHPQCDQAGIVLRMQLPDQPVAANVDEALLKQALLNLMINATQAMTDSASTAEAAGPGVVRGELILRLEADARELRLHVVDTGPGIAPERLEEIFRPYVSDRSGGTGLGLPTARRIIEEHGGRLEVESSLGRGSDFIVHLPRVSDDGPPSG